MTDEIRLRRLHFRAWHRGTKEADLMVGNFFDRYGAGWSDAELDWFEVLMEEQDADIVAWAMGTQPVPDHLQCPQMDAFRRLDYISIP
jgi:antitoxin CptB